MKSFYDILGVASNASADNIKKAYFAMAKKYHPDSVGEKELARFHEVTEAYKTLSKKESRRMYDLSLKEDKTLASQHISRGESSDLHAESPIHTNLYRERISPEREMELLAFHRGIFWKAVFRTLGLALIFAGAGYIDSLLFGGRWYFALVAGAVLGGVIGIYQNFDIHSFFKSARSRLLFKAMMLGACLSSIGYFLAVMFDGLV